MDQKLVHANIDIMTVMSHLRKMNGWESIGVQSLHRIFYLMKVLYSFNEKEHDNLFSEYEFSVTIFGPYSNLVYKSVIFLLSSQRLCGEVKGDLSLNSTDGVDEMSDEKIRWIDTILLILGKYGESKIFSFIINDPLYDVSVKSNQTSTIQVTLENDTLLVLEDFKKAFEETLSDTSTISKEEYISLYFDYIFSQIIS